VGWLLGFLPAVAVWLARNVPPAGLVWTGRRDLIAPLCVNSPRRGGVDQSSGAAFELSVPLVLAVTAALVGAPLVAREVEQRTQLVAWTQSVTRQRWYHSKVVTIGGGLSLAGLLAGTGTYLLQGPLSDGGVTSSRWPWFFSTPWPQPAAPPWRSPSPSPPGPGCDGPCRRRARPGRVPGPVRRGRPHRATLTPVHHTLPGDRGVPRDAWTWPTGTADAIPYHPANQSWPLQLTFLAILLTLTLAVLALVWHATRTRAV
jgi:hypothetical protein